MGLFNKKPSEKEQVMLNLRFAQQSLMAKSFPKQYSKAYVVGNSFYAPLQINVSFAVSNFSDIKRLPRKGLAAFVEKASEEQGVLGFVPATEEAYNYLNDSLEVVGEGFGFHSEDYKAVVFGRKSE